jgi:hypothetical protein
MANLALDQARRRAAGFGFFEPGWDDSLGPPPPNPYDPNAGNGSSGNNGNSGSPPWWVSATPIFGAAAQTISNIFGQYQQRPTYQQPVQYQPQYAAGSSSYDSSGRLVQQSVSSVTSFITSNPLLVIGGVLGVFLLFRPPPGRR